MVGSLNSQNKNGTLTITINGIFDANLVKEFHNAYLDIGLANKEVIIDLANTDYLDSAALGMLIHMKKRLKESSISVIRIVKSNERIIKLFKIMQFDNLFTIEKRNV
ncbi:MAG: anti-anti-sigma factor [Alteromonadaceae bacterium]|jgi:anti-anti-sigma factor